MIQRCCKNLSILRPNKLLDCRYGLLSREQRRLEHTKAMDKNEKLIAVQVVFRHGDRTPLGTYPGDPYRDYFSKLGDFGELTNVGKLNQYKFGQWLRQRYDHLLPKKYSPKDINVVSNDVDRCIMSASCNLTGLYPPQKEDMWHKEILWQPIPVHIDLKLMDPIPHLSQLFSHQPFSDFLTAKTEEYSDLFKQITEHVGKEVNSIWGAIVYRDIFAIQISNNLELPEWAKQIYPFPLENMATELFSIGATMPELSKYAIGPILKSVVDNFENPSKKLHMYSGHDYTITILMGVLAPTYPKFVPEFSTSVIFELVERENKRFVRMLLKRKDNLETIPVLDGGEICVLEEFKEKIKPWCITLEEKAQIFKDPPSTDTKQTYINAVDLSKPDVNIV